MKFIKNILRSSDTVLVSFLAVSALFFTCELQASGRSVYVPSTWARGNFFDAAIDRESIFSAGTAVRYEQSIDKAPLGRYLGPDNKDQFSVGPRYSYDLYTSHFLHGAALDNDLARVKLQPSLRLLGLDMHLFYCAADLNNGRTVVGPFASITFAQVENRLDVSYAQIVRPANENRNLTAFFQGLYERPVGPIDAQAALKNSKFYQGAQIDRGPSSATVGVLVDGNLHAASSYRVQILASIPLDKKNDGTLAFAPQRGMGQHIGLGAAADLTVPLSASAAVTLGVRDTYWCAQDQVRTFGIKNRMYGQYIALARNGQRNEQVFPAANVTTLGCKVTPGHALELQTQVRKSFAGGHAVSLGWQVLNRQAEQVTLTGVWAENTFAIANASYNTTAFFTAPAAAPGVPLGRWALYDMVPSQADPGFLPFLSQDSLDFSVATVPSLMEHSLSLGWECRKKFAGPEIIGGPKISLGFKIAQKDDHDIFPIIFTLGMGYSIIF
jgi:hypothetical protein